MSEYLARHANDFGKTTDLEVFDHCLPSESPVEYGQMDPEQMTALLHDELGYPVELPDLQFDRLRWSVVRWPLNEVALMFGTESSDSQDPDINRALGTVVAWHDGLHVAGLQRPQGGPARVMAGKYVREVDLDGDTHMPLFRGDIVLTQDELALTDEALKKAAKKSYTYLADGDNIVERRFVNPAPSHFDGQTERPFDTAGLITPGMIAASCEESGIDPKIRPVTFTYYHQGWHIPGFAKSWSRRNQILAATPHVSPLEGDAHRIVVNGIAYELPTGLPVTR